MNKDKTPQIVKIQRYLESNYSFRLNVITDRIEFSSKSSYQYEVLEDYHVNSILVEMQSQNLSVNQTMLYQLLYSDFTTTYNPFVEYFSEIEDGEDDFDHIKLLASTVKTNNDEYWHWTFKKWFVAMVASMLIDEKINHHVLVLVGRQGIGKTTWIEKLVPKIFKDYMFSGTINPNNKDTLLKLYECILINLDELENLNRKSIGTLKQLITLSHVSLRKPYGHNSRTLPRRASFAGSVNISQFLNDSTGSRRFLCHEIIGINYKHDLDIAKMYLQAVKLIEDGFVYWFENKENDRINSMNEKHQMRTPSEELLLKYFRKPTPPREKINEDRSSYVDPSMLEKKLYLSASGILERLASISKMQMTYINAIALGRALSKHGFRRLPQNHAYVWEVVERKHIDTEAVDET